MPDSPHANRDVTWKKGNPRPTTPAHVVYALWGLAAGRCQFEGCNKILYRDALTGGLSNLATIAHIVAWTPEGPRGHMTRSAELATDISNLMLTCKDHGKYIDDKNREAEYPEHRLIRFKREHEDRVFRTTERHNPRKTHIVLFGASIGDHGGLVNHDHALEAVLEEGRYPATDAPIAISLADHPVPDSDPSYWTSVGRHVERAAERHFRDGVGPTGLPLHHLSVFALAPIPSLVHFGKHLGDIVTADVFQCHRDPKGWTWMPFDDDGFNFTTLTPTDATDATEVAVNLSLSGTVHQDEIDRAIGRDLPTYTVTVASPRPTVLYAREQLELFQSEWRALLTMIREVHGPEASVHLFPAVPNSVAVEIGRGLLPKADPPVHVYDLHRDAGGFQFALTV